MRNIVLKIHVEDHVSPIMKAISDMLLFQPESLPPLPRPTVIVEEREAPSGPVIRMLPSPEVLSWLGEVRGAQIDRAYLLVPGSHEYRELTPEQVAKMQTP